MDFPTAELKKWFLNEKRSLPWRENPTPYSVWISEVMLQQTQAKVVIPYFERWMEKFPDIQSLAKANGDDVIKTWEGLGYYSRARNLHEGAQFIVNHFNGKFPETENEIRMIKGVGKYTAGAILNFAFHKKACAIDGNVVRLISRFFAIDTPIEDRKTMVAIEEHVQNILPEKESWIISEALIEFGATICQKSPACKKCFMVNRCQGFAQGIKDALPKKKKNVKITHLHRIVAVVLCEDEVLLKKGEKGKVMGELYEFPYAETADFKTGKAMLEKEMGQLVHVAPLKPVEHSFTRYKAFLYPHLFKMEKKKKSHYTWKKNLKILPFSSGHRRIYQQLDLEI